MDPSSRPARVLIVERRPLSASSLARAITRTRDLSVHERCQDAAEVAGALERKGFPDAVTLDPEVYGDEPLRAVETLRAAAPCAHLLLTSSHVDDSLLDALSHEGVSCISAYSEANDVLQALRHLISGHTQLPSDVQSALTQRLRLQSLSQARDLTSREREICQLAAQGLTAAAIALALHISPSTAKTHLRSVYGKLGAPNRSAAVAVAMNQGLIRTHVSDFDTRSLPRR